MNRLRLVAIILLALAGVPSLAAELQYDEAPDDCTNKCFYLSLAALLKLQEEGGDIRTLRDDEFFVTDDPERVLQGKSLMDLNLPSGGISIQVVEGRPLPPLFEEIVRIRFDDGDGREGMCTGVALSRNAVLTAAHCACAEAATYRIDMPKKYDLRDGDDAQRFYDERLLSRAPVPYPQFDCASRSPQPGSDVGLLFLKPVSAKVAGGEKLIAPVAAPMIFPNMAAKAGRLKSLLIVGYGRTETDELPRGMVAAFTEVRDLFCLRNRFGPDGCAPFREFSLSSLARSVRTDTCGGDSGGPVYFIAPRLKANGRAELHRLLVGITSRALGGVPQFSPRNCGGGGIYTAVGHPDILKWLAVNGVPLELWPNARHFPLAKTVMVKARGAQTFSSGQTANGAARSTLGQGEFRTLTVTPLPADRFLARAEGKAVRLFESSLSSPDR